MSEKKYVSSENYLKEALKNADMTGVYIAPEIPEKKLVNACRYIGNEVSPGVVVGLIDTTLLGSAKEGFLFTGTDMYYKMMLEKPSSINYADIEKVECVKQEKKKSDGTIEVQEKVSIENKSGDVHTYFFSSKNQVIADILDGVINNTETIESSEQLIRLEDLSEDIKEIYMQIIINYLRADDDMIDNQEYKELMALQAKSNITTELSARLRDYRFQKDNQIETEVLIKELKESIANGSIQNIYHALINDLILVKKSVADDWENDETFLYYKNMLDITDKQVEFFLRKMKDDERIINERLDDNSVKKLANEMVALGGAAGVSLTALALTGGISTGVWGGLIALGTASTGGMFLGLAAVAGLGYASYKGVKYFSRTSELEKYGIQSGMLQERIMLLQRSQGYLLEDINWTTEKIDKLVQDKDNIMENLEEIQQLMKLNRNLSQSGKIIMEEEDKNKENLMMSKLPQVLDAPRYHELVNKTSHAEKFNEFVFSFYIKNDEEKYVLAEGIRGDILEKLFNVLQQIGYYDTQKSAMAQGSILKKQGVEALKSFFN